MNRLKDQESSPDAAVAEAAELAQAASHLALDPRLKTRIRARLMETHSPRLSRRLRPAFVVVLLVSAIAVAGATVGRIWVRHRDADNPPAADTHERTVVTTRAPESAAKLHPVPSVTLPQPDATNAHEHWPVQGVANAPSESSQRPSQQRAVATPAEIQRRTEADHEPAPTASARVPVPAALAPESILVVDATHALHYEHDPARALKLLDEYLRSYPRGELVEESLALAIEASSARGDKAAAGYARTYLERFPQGRFREAALHALGRFAP